MDMEKELHITILELQIGVEKVLLELLIHKEMEMCHRHFLLMKVMKL